MPDNTLSLPPMLISETVTSNYVLWPAAYNERPWNWATVANVEVNKSLNALFHSSNGNFSSFVALTEVSVAFGDPQPNL